MRKFQPLPWSRGSVGCDDGFVLAIVARHSAEAAEAIGYDARRLFEMGPRHGLDRLAGMRFYDAQIRVRLLSCCSPGTTMVLA